MQHRATISVLLAAGVLAGCVTAPEEETVTDLVFASVSAGFLHTCGVTTGGTAHCWGWNVFAQLGNGNTTSKVTPVPVAGGLTFAPVNAAWKHTCGLTTSGTAYCWGDNHRGQLGDGTTTGSFIPVRVSGQL